MWEIGDEQDRPSNYEDYSSEAEQDDDWNDDDYEDSSEGKEDNDWDNGETQYIHWSFSDGGSYRGQALNSVKHGYGKDVITIDIFISAQL